MPAPLGCKAGDGVELLITSLIGSHMHARTHTHLTHHLTGLLSDLLSQYVNRRVRKDKNVPQGFSMREERGIPVVSLVMITSWLYLHTDVVAKRLW